MAQTMHLKRRRSIPTFFVATLGTLLLGTLAGWFSGSKRGYTALVLPPATPPNIVFPIVWTVLYIMIGMSLFFIMRTWAVTDALEDDRKVATFLWALQFFFNLAWPFAFFTLRLYAFSALWLAVLVGVNIALMLYAFRVKMIAGWLLVPYQAWLTFAFYLNLFVAILN